MYSHLFARLCRALWKCGLILFLVVLGSSGVLADTYTVTGNTDGAGSCTPVATPPPDSNCDTLRAAITAANGTTIDDTIVLSAGTTYTLTGASGNDNNSSGDLDIGNTTIVEGKLTIEGNGATINGGAIDRVLHVLAGADLTIRNLTVMNGKVGASTDGGGIWIVSGKVTIDGSTIGGVAPNINEAGQYGGGIRVEGSSSDVTITNSTISGNKAINNGGGISISAGTLNINSSTIKERNWR